MALAFLIPGRLDQVTGGYIYDRHIVLGLRARGRAVDVIELPGRYPDADDATRADAMAALARVPDGSTVVIDGLALPGLADGLREAARRLTLIGLIHHPLSLETGLDPELAHRYAQMEAALWPCLKGVICPSAHTARAVMASGLPADRIAVVAPGVSRPVRVDPSPAVPIDRHRDPSPHRPELCDPARPVQLLAVGTISPRKGQLLLVDALAAMEELHGSSHGGVALPAWHLTCIGSLDRHPVAAATLRERIAAHALGDRIDLQGEQPPERLAQAYLQADLFVLPSYHEGYGMVYAEALAHGLPVIATTAGAIPDTVPAAAALLVPPGNVAALRDALHCAMTDAALRARLAAAAVQAAGQLKDWNHTASHWMAALDEVSR